MEQDECFDASEPVGRPHRATLPRLPVALMAVLVLRLGDEFRRLTWESGRSGAIDLRILHELVYRWLAGRPVYSELITAVHPLATYVILWLLLDFTALVARFWPYHRWYDDLLILLPMNALFRIAKQRPSADGGDVVAGAFLAITMLAMLALGGLYLLPSLWNMLYVAGQTIVWIVVLVFLLDRTCHERNAEVG
jgi:hypothetical protein